jgi:4-carboxymuconolactone decarboxylase
MARIPVFSNAADVPDKQRAAADAVMGVFGRIRGPFSVLLHSPDLTERLLPMVPFTRDHTMVEGPLRSLAILAFAREREGPYVWAAQVDAARRNGLREEAIDLLRAKGDPAALTPEERDVVVYIRQLARTNRVEQAAFDALNSRYSPQWMVEMTAIASFYGMLCGVVSAFEVSVPEGGDRY